MNEVLRVFTISDIQRSPLEMKVYASCVRISMIYGSETRVLRVDVGLNLQYEMAELQMSGWMCAVSVKEDSETWRNLFGVELITTVIRSGRLRWYGHEIRVNG